MLSINFSGSVLQPAPFGIVKATTEHNAIYVIGKQSLNIATHVIAIGLVWLRADVKGCDTFMSVWSELGFDALGLIFGLMERSSADWY